MKKRKRNNSPPSHQHANPTTNTNTNYHHHLDITTLFPEEILSQIFFDGYLDTIFVIQIISCQISKSIQRLAQRHVSFLDLRKCLSLTPSHIQNLTVRYSNLQSLNLTYCSQFQDSHMEHLKYIKYSLRRLYLKGCSVTDKGMYHFLVSEEEEELLNSISNLNSNSNLTLTSTSTSTTALPLPLPLEELDVSVTTRDRAHNIGDDSIHILAKTCPKIRKLFLGLCLRITDHSISIISQHFPLLYELDLSLTSITSESSSCLSHMIHHHNLRSLDISATQICDEGIQTLAASGRMNKPIYLPSHSCFLKKRTIHDEESMSLLRYSSRLRRHRNSSSSSSSSGGGTGTGTGTGTEDTAADTRWEREEEEEEKEDDHRNYTTSHHPPTVPSQEETPSDISMNTTATLENASSSDANFCFLKELRLRHLSISIRSLEILSINAKQLRILDISYCHPGAVSWDRATSNSFRERIMKEFQRNGTEICNEEHAMED